MRRGGGGRGVLFVVQYHMWFTSNSPSPIFGKSHGQYLRNLETWGLIGNQGETMGFSMSLPKN